MKNKIIIAAAVLSVVTLLSSCSGDKPNKAPDDTTAKEYPENGVYYEYSSGGNSERVVSSITFKDGLAISSNEYDYWEDGKLKTVTTKVGDKTVEAWNYLYTEDGVLSQSESRSRSSQTGSPELNHSSFASDKLLIYRRLVRLAKLFPTAPSKFTLPFP